jgi:hypothetical protein
MLAAAAVVLKVVQDYLVQVMVELAVVVQVLLA